MMKTTHTIKDIKGILNASAGDSSGELPLHDRATVHVLHDFLMMPDVTTYSRHNDITSVSATGLWNEPLDADMSGRVAFVNMKAGDSLLLSQPETEFTQYHSLVFCMAGTTNTQGQALTNKHVGYNPPHNLLSLQADTDASLMVIRLAQVPADSLPAYVSGDAFQIKSLEHLNWVNRPGREALICYPQNDFGFTDDFDNDPTFQGNKFKLLYFEDGTALKAHLHTTTQFKALVSGHIVYQDQYEKLEKDNLLAGHLGSVTHHTTYKGNAEEASYMVLMDLTPEG